MGNQRADVTVIAAFRCGDNRTVMLAESQQGFFIAQAFEQRQAQGLARTFVLPGRVFHASVVEGLRLIVVTGGDERQGVGEGVFAALEAGAQGVQITHWVFLWRTLLAFRRWLHADIGIYIMRTVCRSELL